MMVDRCYIQQTNKSFDHLRYDEQTYFDLYFLNAFFIQFTAVDRHHTYQTQMWCHVTIM